MNIVYINSVNSPYVLDLSNVQTGLMNTQEVRLLADTTGSAISIYLPAISAFPAQNVKIYVTDYLGNAANNNITVYAYSGNTINGASSAIVSTDNGFIKLEIGSTNEWVSVSQSSGGGGGSDVTVMDFDVTIPFARIQQLLNDGNQFETIIAPPALNEVIEVITANVAYDSYGGVAYNGGDPKLILCGIASDNKTLIFTTTNNVLHSAYTGVPSPFFFAMSRAYTDPKYNTGGSGGQVVGFGVYLRNDQNYVVTQGNSDIRFFGTYRIKKMS